MAGLQRSGGFKKKWTTFSWVPPTERRIGRDSEWEMVKNGKKKNRGRWCREISSKSRLMEMDGGELTGEGVLTKEQQMFLEFVSKCISITTFRQLVLQPWRLQNPQHRFPFVWWRQVGQNFAPTEIGGGLQCHRQFWSTELTKVPRRCCGRMTVSTTALLGNKCSFSRLRLSRREGSASAQAWPSSSALRSHKRTLVREQKLQTLQMVKEKRFKEF